VANYCHILSLALLILLSNSYNFVTAIVKFMLEAVSQKKCQKCRKLQSCIILAVGIVSSHKINFVVVYFAYNNGCLASPHSSQNPPLPTLTTHVRIPRLPPATHPSRRKCRQQTITAANASNDPSSWKSSLPTPLNLADNVQDSQKASCGVATFRGTATVERMAGGRH